MTDAAPPRRPPVRVGILSHGTSEFDSRAHRVARSLAAAGDTVTLYSRHRPGLPLEETLDGYRVVRLPVSGRSLRIAADAADAATSGGLTPFAVERLSGTPAGGPDTSKATKAKGSPGGTRRVGSVTRAVRTDARRLWRAIRPASRRAR